MTAKLVFILVCALTVGRAFAIPTLGSLLNNILGTGDDKGAEVNIVKDVTDTVADTLSDITGLVDDLAGRWKIWTKNLNCTVESNNFVTCVLTTSDAKDNPDSWKVIPSEVKIPNAPPEGCANKTLPQKVDGDLFVWLSNFF